MRTAKEGWHIRRAVESDAAEIARLTTQLGYPATTEQIRSRLAALLCTDDHCIAVAAERDTHLSGWIGAEQRMLLALGMRVEIVGLVVESEARRRGIGQALVQTVEEWARGRNVEILFVRSNVTRRESHSFYEALGFEWTKTQHAYGRKLGEGSSG